MNKKRFKLFFTLLFVCIFNFSLLAQTTIKKIENDWTLLVDEKPFEIKGATFGHDKDVENYDTYFKDLKFPGVNSIRL